MENNERDRKLDQWLDQALSEYNAAEPRFGLEQRVLNRVRSEEKPLRTWNLWRWMPAFAAIAAVIVVAVAIHPVLEKKTPEMNSSIDTYTRPTAPAPKNNASESVPDKRATSTKPADQPQLNDSLRKAPTMPQEAVLVPQKQITPQPRDRDRLITAQDAKTEDRLPATRTNEKKAPASSSTAVSVDGSVAVMAPPPPPPVKQLQPGVAGGIVGGTVADAPANAATTASVTTNGIAPKSNPQTAEAKPTPPVLLNDKAAAESAMSVIAKDARRKEAHTKPDTPREDANVMDVMGVRVRFETGPSTQQFPTPVPLSTQEKLALKAGPELKNTAVADHKSTEITPLEIKDVEIKPLEGSEKEK